MMMIAYSTACSKDIPQQFKKAKVALKSYVLSYIDHKSEI